MVISPPVTPRRLHHPSSNNAPKTLLVKKPIPSELEIFNATNKILNSRSTLLPSSMDYQIKAGSEFRFGDPPVVAPPPARRWHIDGASGLPTSRAMRLAGNALRGAAALLTFVAAIVMGTAAQTKRVVVIDDSGSPVTLAGTAKSHYSSALVYFIVINALVILYSVATIALYYASKKAIMVGIYLPLTITDLITMVFLVSCNGAASAISVVAENGNRHFGWDKICVSVGQYCAQVAVAIVLSMLATVAYVLLILLTIVALHKRL